MILEILKEWNPWWENKELVKDLEGTKRPEYQDLLDSIKIKEITIILGVRRSGKSTLMYQIVDSLLKQSIKPEQILFVNLEDKKLTNLDLEEIYNEYRENLNPKNKAYIFLDEIHRKKDWETWIRKKYDLKTNDKFVISGSCSYLLKKEYSTLLTGRNLTFEVFPLSFKEYLRFKNVNFKSTIILDNTKRVILNNLKQYLELGGFPEVFFKEEKYKIKILEQYFDDIIYKDIIDRYNLNSQKVKDLALFFTTNFTGEISLRNLRNTLGLSYDSIKDYLSYFKEAFLFFTLDHFSYSFKEQKTVASKIYCIDNGLRNAVSFKFSKDSGKLAENTAFIELKRRDQEIYYYSDEKECDFVIKEGTKITQVIQVCYVLEHSNREREIKGILEAMNYFKLKEGLILTFEQTEELELDGKKIKILPVFRWMNE